MSAEKVLYVSVLDVVPNPNQPRREFDQRALEQLAESIDTQGLIQPIVVREVESDGKKIYELIAGERRLRAIRDILGRDRIKVLVQQITETQSEEMALVENIQRADLSPIEEALAITSLMAKEGLTQVQVAKRIGKSRSDTGNLIRLLKLDRQVQDLLASGTLLRTVGIRLSSVDDPEQQRAWAKKVIDHGWNYEQFRAALEKAGENAVKQRKCRFSRPSEEEQTKNLVLVEFEDQEATNEFFAYMVEQGYPCACGPAILEKLKQRMTRTEVKQQEDNKDIFSEVETDVGEQNQDNVEVN